MNRIRKRKKLKLSTQIFIIIILISTLTYFFVHSYLQNLNPKIIEVSEQKIDKSFQYFLSTDVGYQLLNGLDLEDIIEINKNSAGEILNVDFDLDKAYQVLAIITTELTGSIKRLESGKINLVDENILSHNGQLVLELPMFIASKYALLSNLGPKIYLQINFIGNLLTNLKTKVTNYGLNNALVEVYVSIEISRELISPVVKNTNTISYDVLISSKIINGRVPAFYGDSLVKESNIVEEKVT